MDDSGNDTSTPEDEPPRRDAAFVTFGYAMVVGLLLAWTVFTVFAWNHLSDPAFIWPMGSAAIYAGLGALALILRSQTAIRLEKDTITFGRGRRRRTLAWRETEARWDGANYIVRAGRTVVRINSHYYDRQHLFDFFRRRFAGFALDPERFHRSMAAMSADRIIVVNESAFREAAGDLTIYVNAAAAALSLEAIDVANGEYHVFRLDGCPMIQRVSGETVTLTLDDTAIAQPALVATLLRHAAEHISVRRRRAPPPSNATPLELVDYIGFSR